MTDAVCPGVTSTATTTECFGADGAETISQGTVAACTTLLEQSVSNGFSCTEQIKDLSERTPQ